MRKIQLTTKVTKVSDIYYSELRALRTTMLNNCLRLRKLLSGQGREFCRAGLARGQHCCNHVSSFFRHDITMSLGHFGNQTMGAQQSEPPSHRCHLPALLFSVLGGIVEMSTQIAIAKPVERKLAPVDDGQKLSVGVPQRIERTVAPSITPHNRPAYGRCLLCQRSADIHRGQSGEIAVGGTPADLRTPMQISHATAQRAPLLLTLRLILRPAPDSELFGLVDRGLYTQNAALVVALHRVLMDPVLNSHALDTPSPISFNFTLNRRPARMPQKAQHLFTAKAHHRMMHQRWINPLQRSTLAKHYVGGVFALGSRPVVVSLDGPGDFGAKRMALFDQRVDTLDQRVRSCSAINAWAPAISSIHGKQLSSRR